MRLFFMNLPFSIKVTVCSKINLFRYRPIAHSDQTQPSINLLQLFILTSNPSSDDKTRWIYGVVLCISFFRWGLYVISYRALLFRVQLALDICNHFKMSQSYTEWLSAMTDLEPLDSEFLSKTCCNCSGVLRVTLIISGKETCVRLPCKLPCKLRCCPGNQACTREYKSQSSGRILSSRSTGTLLRVSLWWKSCWRA